MKKILIGFVLAAILSVCAFAVSPAVNVLTGTKDALNFENATDDYFYNSNTQYLPYFSYGVKDDVTGEGRGKVFSVEADMDKMTADKGAETFIYFTLARTLPESVDRPVCLVFETFGTKSVGFWLIESSHVTIGALNRDNAWNKYSFNSTSAYDGSIGSLQIQFATRSLDCAREQYFDNIALYPYYKIDYVHAYPDGSEGEATTKYFFDASNLTIAKDGTVSGFPASYTLENVTVSFPGYDFLGWTTEKDSDAIVTSVDLSGEDITLYPVWEKKAYVAPVNVTVYLDEAKTETITEVSAAGYLFKLPTYKDLEKYTKEGKMPSGFRMNGTLYAPGTSVMLPEEDSVVFTAEYADTLHAEYGELVMLENFEALENGTFICDADKGESYPINPSYINPSWSTNKEHFQFRYGDSMNNLQVAQVDGNNALKVTKFNATAQWPQFYLFNNGGTPDGLYTFVATFTVPKSDVSHIQSLSVRAYYSGSYKSVSIAPGSGDNVITVACPVSVAKGSDITDIPRIQIYASTDAADLKTTFYVDNVSVYYKNTSAVIKLSDTKEEKIFFTPGDEITLPYSYEIMDSIPEGYVLSGFSLNGKMYSEGETYTTKPTDSYLNFKAVYEEKVYALKFETGTANGTVGEIEILDGEKVNLPSGGLYHPTAKLAGWALYGSDKVYPAGSEFKFNASEIAEYLDGTDRLIFTPVFDTPDTKSYYFAESFSLPSVSSSENVTYTALAKFADRIYYGVRREVSPNTSDEARLLDMISKGVLDEGASLSDTVSFEEASFMIANVLPEKFYNELCFNVDVENAECKKLVRAGILDESTDFSKIMTGEELATAVNKLCGISSRNVENKRTIFFIGDSLSEAYPEWEPMFGWPEFLDDYLTGNMNLENYAVRGYDTGTYYNLSNAKATEYYTKMITSVRRGDYVIIALGANDSTLWGRGDMTKDESRANFYRYICEIRAQGGIPVLVGPSGRYVTDENGNLYDYDPDIFPVLQSVNEIYGVNVPLINFKDISLDYYVTMTEAEKDEFFVDNIHYTAKGADIVASWFEELLLGTDHIQLVALKNHCENYAQEEIPAEYFTINIGERQSETNVRYAEVDGYRTKIAENGSNTFVLNLSSNTVVAIIEKASKDTAEIVKSEYYFVDASAKTYTKLDMDSYMTTDGTKSIRIKEPMGIRFKSEILTAAKSENTRFVIDEYGFIVATEKALDGAELTFDFSKYVTGVAYNKADGIDILFDSNDNVHTFTGIVKNIPAKEYKTNLVCKTYTKISVGTEQFTLYGEAVTGNVYDAAKALYKDTTLDSETRGALLKIILDGEGVIGLPGDDLFD